MKIRLITLIIFLILSHISFGQIGLDVRTFQLDVIPEVSVEEDSIFGKEGVFCPIFKYAYEYVTNEQQDIDLWEMEYKTFKIYDQKNVQEFKKITISENDWEQFTKVQVRVIRNGNIIANYTQKDIVKTKPTGEEFARSALELKIPDLTIGDLIEILFIKKRPYIIDQDFTYLQHSYPIKNLDYTLIMPSHLKPLVQLYNEEYPIIDTVIEKNRTRYTNIHIDYMPACKKVPVSFYEKNLFRVEYTIAYNYASSRLRMNATKDFVNSFGNRIQLKDKTQINILKKSFIKQIKFPKNSDNLVKIKVIENFMKEHLGGIDMGVLQMVRLYTYVFDYFDLKYNMVITNDKTMKEFDRTFNGTNFYKNYLFHFPEYNYYISPSHYSYRNGLIPYHLTGNGAIYLERVLFNDEQIYIHSFVHIPEGIHEAGIDQLYLTLKIDPNTPALLGSIERKMGSYHVHYIQANFNAFQVEDREQMIELFLTLNSESTFIKDEQFYNIDSKDIGIEPLVIKGSLTNSEWIQKNGTGLDLFIGKMIGNQDRLPSDQPRFLPVEKEFANSYERVIQLQIPDGYHAGDLSKLNIEIYDTDESSKATAGFISSYKIEGKTITITVKEFYNKLYYPVEEFPLYEKVANSAADFNKIVIQLLKD
ncbi:MAG TPA: DUF3857 domain-containing protein [Bacteroidales bacterium]|nr:DUF3857 domain-containing protein [Bacteroidales bacterium]